MKGAPLIFYSTLCVLNSAFSQTPEPASQPSNMQFANVTGYGLSMSFTTTAANGYLVLKSDKSISDVPVDGTSYQKGQGLSSCKVMYVGPDSVFNVREILEGTKYYFKVFAFNGSGNTINYLQTNPLSDSVTTPVSDPGNYYALIDSNAGTLISDLHNLINPHTMNSYSPGYINSIFRTIYERDTTGGQEVINCDYSNETTVYTPPFTFNGQQYNREHVLCKSWMQTYAQYGANVTNYPEGSDYFNLLLTRATPNQVRSNYPEGIVANVISTYGESKFGTDVHGNTVFEPKDNRKGDAARCMMYEMICSTD